LGCFGIAEITKNLDAREERTPFNGKIKLIPRSNDPRAAAGAPSGKAVAAQLPGHDHSTRSIRRVHLDRSLRQVDADTCNLAHGLSCARMSVLDAPTRCRLRILSQKPDGKCGWASEARPMGNAHYSDPSRTHIGARCRLENRDAVTRLDHYHFSHRQPNDHGPKLVPGLEARRLQNH
jgi:hypothetical protein